MENELSPAWFEEIDHTADIGIFVTADSLPQLFERAAWGMFRVLTEVDDVIARDGREITVSGEDRDDLMVKWLSELNFLHITQGLLFCRFEIKDLTDTHLKGTALGEEVDPDRHAVLTEIKAITYHELEILQDNDEWSVQVIFDM